MPNSEEGYVPLHERIQDSPKDESQDTSKGESQGETNPAEAKGDSSGDLSGEKSTPNRTIGQRRQREGTPNNDVDGQSRALIRAASRIETVLDDIDILIDYLGDDPPDVKMVYDRATCLPSKGNTDQMYDLRNPVPVMLYHIGKSLIEIGVSIVGKRLLSD